MVSHVDTSISELVSQMKIWYPNFLIPENNLNIQIPDVMNLEL